MVVMMFMRIMTRVVRIVIIYVSEVSRIIRDGLCHRPPQRCGAPCSLVALRRSTLQAMVICEHFRSIVASRGSEFAQAQHSARLCSSAPWRQCRRCWQRFLWQHHAVQRWLSFEDCRPTRTKLMQQIRLLSAQHGEAVSCTVALRPT